MVPTETNASPPPSKSNRLLDEIQMGRREFFKVFGPGALITLRGFAIAIYFVEPPPPNKLIIAAGPVDGGYYAAAKQYEDMFARQHLTLEVLMTAGTRRSRRDNLLES